jgi:hypothetical protein
MEAAAAPGRAAQPRLRVQARAALARGGRGRPGGDGSRARLHRKQGGKQPALADRCVEAGGGQTGHGGPQASTSGGPEADLTVG